MTNMLGRYFNPFRLATYLLILYCAGHTWGTILSTPHFGEASDAVAYAMKSVHFNVQGFECTWFGFYVGFGLLVSIFFLCSAAVTWFLGGLARSEQRGLAPITWALFLSYLASAVIAWAYFFVAPGVFSTLIAALLGFQCLKTIQPELANKRVA
jgi:hypothetical protein